MPEGFPGGSFIRGRILRRVVHSFACAVLASTTCTLIISTIRGITTEAEMEWAS